VARRLSITALLIVVVASGCATPPPIPNGINQDKAIELARQHAGEGLQEVVQVRFGFRRDLRPSDGVPVDLAMDRALWIVDFNASIDRPCGPAPGGRFCHVAHVKVVLDARTGDVLTMSMSGSGG
jgi:hypothetical protein